MNREIFTRAFIQGARFPDGDNLELRVTTGLPEGSKLVGISMDYAFSTGGISLKFENPLWPELSENEPITEACVEYTAEPILQRLIETMTEEQCEVMILALQNRYHLKKEIDNMRRTGYFVFDG